MEAVGRDPARYGAHSLRIGGATCMGFLGAPPEAIKAAGRWRSEVYLRYVRESAGAALSHRLGIAGAEPDDFQADFVEIDDFEFDESDLE